MEAFEDSSSSIGVAGTSQRGEAGADPAKPDSDPVCVSDPVWVDDGVHSPDRTDAGRPGLLTSTVLLTGGDGGGSGALPLRHPPLLTEFHSPDIDWSACEDLLREPLFPGLEVTIPPLRLDEVLDVFQALRPNVWDYEELVPWTHPTGGRAWRRPCGVGASVGSTMQSDALQVGGG